MTPSTSVPAPAQHAAREPATVEQLLTRRLVVVTGKGGTGKSTVAAALALAVARRGRRAAVVEVAGRRDVARAIGARDGGRGRAYVQRAIAPRVDHLSVDPRHALREYLRRQLPGPAAAVLLAGGA
ncbi:MAG TPA: P-loop NTPase, partial [Baekduia sp.]|nr:P-loop NTPase [Baekduia sp.]